ncbi:ABC transporter permease, partial [Leisingera daeponensis]|nr:ABC transporter permease [Leisingera daeponensis]
MHVQSEAGKGYSLSAPASLYVGVLVAAPLGILVAYSFWTQTYVEIDRTLTWANYLEAATDPLVRHLMLRSIAIAGAVTMATVALAYPIAYFIAFRTRKKTL